MSMLQYLSNSFAVDERQNIWEFSLFGLGRFGLVGCDLKFWAISFFFLSAECLWNCAFAYIIYKWIVPYQKTTHAYVLGYGVILPLILASPFWLLHMIPLSNIAFLLCFVGGTASLIIFRCVEAMHGLLPKFSTTSLSVFMLYYASALQFQIDETSGMAVKVTRKELTRKIFNFAGIFVRTSLLYSILLPCGYKLFDYPPIQGLAEMFHWRHLANNFLMACLTSVLLECKWIHSCTLRVLLYVYIPQTQTIHLFMLTMHTAGAVGLGILTSLLSGMSVIDPFDSPLTKSASPSDFWSRRWNRITQSGLRRGVFLPLLQCGASRTGAALGTFVASGILHEYVLLIMKQRQGKPNNPAGAVFEPNYGNHFRFFLWCGIVIWVEKLTRSTAPVLWMQKHLPQPVRTFLVLMTVLPIVNLFTDEYIASSFYNDAAFGFVRISHLSNELVG